MTFLEDLSDSAKVILEFKKSEFKHLERKFEKIQEFMFNMSVK